MHEPYFREITIPRPGDIGGGEWRLSQLTNLVAIFGKNGSGKSRLLRAWRDQDVGSAHYIIPERSGELDYQPQFLGQQANPNVRKDQSQRNFNDNYRRHIIVRIQTYLASRGGYGKEGTPPCPPADLSTEIGRLLPDFEVTIVPTAIPPYRLTRSSDGASIETIDQLSSGEAQILLLGLDILTAAALWEIGETATRIMLIDEPDAHVHPDLLVRFADFLNAATEKYKFQSIIATHSTSLLAALGQFGGNEASVVYLDRVSEDFEAHLFDDILKELASCLGGHALMGPLFGVPLLLVEGDDDYRIWSQVPRHHQVSFSVLPSGGQQILSHQRALERVLQALRDPDAGKSGFALVDGDKGMPAENAETPQQHIAFMQLNCRESENLFLADEVLQILGLNWEVAQERIAAQAHEYGQKEANLSAVIGCDRRNHDLKPVIEPLSLILDEKRVHWTVRVAAVIGKNRPSGQIAHFLGDQVVNAIWGVP